MQTLVTFYTLLGHRRRRELVLVTGMTVLSALAEMATIGVAVPFLAAVVGMQPNTMITRIFRPVLISDLGIDPIITAGLFLASIVITAALARLVMMWLIQRFVAGIGHELTMRIWQQMLHQPYAAYLERNSSTVLGGLEKVRPAVANVILPTLQGLGAAIVAMLLGGFVFFIARGATLLIALPTISMYIATSILTRRRLHLNSVTAANAVGARTKLVQEGLGSFRDIILAKTQTVFQRRLQSIDADQRSTVVSNALITAAPRLLAEATVVVAIIAITITASQQSGGLIAAIPTLGALALGGQRLMPLLQQVYTSWSQANGNMQMLRDVLVLVDAPRPPSTSAPTHIQPITGGDIRFEDVAFAYRNGAAVLHNVNLTIHKGERIGLVGLSGSGKSTLLDLLMGLLEPTRGSISVDGKPLDEASRTAWQAQLAHVPQAIYLVDDSIMANIAFAVEAEKIDSARLARAVAAAHLAPLLDDLQGLGTIVAERGVRLSGGQRQRIGIARALYHATSLLVLDEATSALDEDTEAAILASIATDYPGMTVVIVAHRPSSLLICDRILDLTDGRITEHDRKKSGIANTTTN